MKKTTAILLGTLIASSAVFAQSNVLSRNAVGYIKRTVPAGGLDLVSIPFESMDGSGNTINSSFSGLQDGSRVSLWDAGAQSYKTFQKSKGSWGTPGTNVVLRGEALFLRAPAGSSQEVYLMGEVPDSTTAPSTTVSVVSGLNMVGSGYPVSTAWTGTTLSASLPDGSRVSVWDGSSYVTIQKAKGSWGASGNSLVIEPGDGVFIRSQSGSTIDWNQTKPYNWP